MARHRRELFVAAQLLLGAVVLYFAGRAIADQWRELPPESFALEPRWGIIALSSAVVLANYVVLIETWRRVLRAWTSASHPREGGAAHAAGGFEGDPGATRQSTDAPAIRQAGDGTVTRQLADGRAVRQTAHRTVTSGRTLAFLDAARIWFVSNLGRFIPGRIWQIGALAVMAQRRGIPAMAATGAAILVNLVSVLVGFALALMFGARTLQRPDLALAAVLAGMIVVAAAPAILPRAARVIEKVTGKSVPIAAVPARAIWISAIGTGIAWLLYGAAFQLLALGSLGHAAGAWTEYVAVFAGSYLVGYLAVIFPGGLFVREGALTLGLTTLGLATAPEAVILAVVSRLWLTVLEVVPGALFLLRPDRGARLTDQSGDVSSA